MKTVRTACVVLPTYNEAENIREVLDTIFFHRRRLQYPVDMHVLVVDDNSPDGTADIVQTYEHPNVHLLSREDKQGLGKAYIAGFAYAMEHLDPDVVFEMDADLSHNPADLYRMLDKIKRGADVVIGSRYVPGGEIPDWGVDRRLISFGGNFVARVVAGLYHVKDCTSGFRAVHTSKLEQIDMQELDVSGFAFQIAFLEALLKEGAIVTEIPIKFEDRKAGESKMSVKDITEVGKVAIRIGTSKVFVTISEAYT